MSNAARPLARIEGYTLERKLCQGGMAEVYLARRDGDAGGPPVVIKSVLPAFVGDGGFARMMVNEARIAAGVSHPNVVRIHDLIEVDGRPFIVMEYLDGVNLMQVLNRAIRRERSLSIGFICHVVGKVLAALAHAHDCCDGDGRPLGLVHRDVSPGNVVVTFAGRVKLIDFGIAKATLAGGDGLTQVGQLKGKSSYMSPEQARCEPLDRRSDLFSVGVVLWELLTQRRLFARRLEADRMIAICCQDAPPPSSIAPELSPAFDRICARALAREREGRYATAGEMARDLQALCEAEPAPARPEDLQAELRALFPVEHARHLRSAGDATLVSGAPSALYEDETLAEMLPTIKRGIEPTTITPRTPPATVSRTGPSIPPPNRSLYDLRAMAGASLWRSRVPILWLLILWGVLLLAIGTLLQRR